MPQFIDVGEVVGTHRRTQRLTEERREVHVAALEAALRRVVQGEVRFDRGSRALYATDGSNYRQVPIGVVIPRSVEDAVHTVATARRHGAPVLSRGGGTSLAGQCCNVAVVLDWSKYLHHILELDPERRRARVQPGLVLDDLRNAAERHHLTFGPDPSTHNHCTLGGMIGNNSCGVHSVMAGETADNVESLEVLTYDGLRLKVGPTDDEQYQRIVAEGGRRAEIYRGLRSLRDRYADQIRAHFPPIPRRVSGYNLPALLPENGFNVARALVGSECTCVTILEAAVRLVPSPPVRSLAVLGYPDVYQAGDHIPDILRYAPIGLEGMDDRLVDDMVKMRIHPKDVKLLPEGRGWLLVEFGGDSKEESDGKARRMMEALRGVNNPPHMKLYDDPPAEDVLWTVRKSGLGATAHVPCEPPTWEGWEDSSVPVERLGEYLRELRQLFNRYEYGCSLYGHFGQGCVHTRIDFDLETADGIKKFRSFLFDAADLVLSLGGSISGEHGDGQSKAELLPKMFGSELMQAFEEFKSIWDPQWKMNPGKIVRPYRVDENLRLGTAYHPPDPPTHFAFPSDEYSFARASIRCVGVGECRREEGKTMCPSYRVTREEMHSTRGRAHLLFEMLQGDPLNGGWRDEHVKESLTLCLACKGCKSDCPVNVDMASYKAEFLSHYYAGRIRPPQAYSMGLIYWWARLASYVPDLANFLTQTPGLSTVAKAVGGIAQERDMPAFASPTFTEWFRRRPPRRDGVKVMLWPDTFNNYFFPRTARAAVEVLEAAGCRVVIPLRPLCCGRPLYDFGMLDLAKRQLRQILSGLRGDIAAGTPIVGLEPSCVAVFRDELVNLFPHDEMAKRLSHQMLTLGEFLKQRRPDWRPPRLEKRALVHGHCHHKAVMGFAAEPEVLKRAGLDVQVLDSGCCGMAGSFGFKQEHYEVSQRIGDLVLLPAVRQAPADSIIVADGFSCREQIAQATNRRALHAAEVLHFAMQQAERRRADGTFPETGYLARQAPLGRPRRVMPLLLAGALLAFGLLRTLQRRTSPGTRHRRRETGHGSYAIW
ncbi:MAG TPA: FAD-linked oxidase C-terminal domain-containing protein [Nitrospira sp.]|nr:FAD-linked oxidase C-terminal domain-containing protein [Nitrospira sp.]